MDLSANSWVPQLYLRVNYAWARFFHGERTKTGFHDYVRGSSITHTNLCTFIRTIFLWGTLYAFLMLVPVYLYYIALIAFPISYFGTMSVLRVLAFGMGGLFLIGVTFLVLSWLLGVFVNSRMYRTMWDSMKTTYQTRRRIRIEEAERRQATKVEKGPGIFKLLWTWLQDKHSNMCTIIKIEVK